MNCRPGCVACSRCRSRVKDHGKSVKFIKDLGEDQVIAIAARNLLHQRRRNKIDMHHDHPLSLLASSIILLSIPVVRSSVVLSALPVLDFTTRVVGTAAEVLFLADDRADRFSIRESKTFFAADLRAKKNRDKLAIAYYCLHSVVVANIIGGDAFRCCRLSLHILLGYCAASRHHRANEVFDGCENLTKVELVGEIHEIVPYLSLKSWREAVYEQIDYINQVLPNTPANEKTEEIKEWMESVKDSYEYYKAVHFCWVDDVTTLLELALWKINIDGKERSLGFQDGDQTTRERAQRESRQETRVTSGASVVIKHVISFIELPWTF
eukprot:scaffold33158_cov137-Skeletonema_marinoi.AAC.3